MSEQTDTTLRELEEVTKGSEPTSEGTVTAAPSANGEQPTEPLESIVKPNPATAAVNATNAEDTWVNKILNDPTGKAMEELENNPTLGWLKKRVDARINPVEQPESKTFAQQMVEHTKDQERSTLMEKAKALPIDQRKEVTSKVREAVEGLGADPVKALKKALSEIKEGSTPAPIATSGRASNASGSISLEQFSKLPQSEYEAMDKKIKAGEIQILS